METLKVYLISDKVLGDSNTVLLYPRIPESAGPREPEILRICCCQTIIGCLQATESTDRFGYGEEYDDGIPLWVYTANVKVSKLYQPIKEVPDAWKTGELWIMEPQEFNLVAEYRLIRHMRIDSVYSRYAFYRIDTHNKVNDKWADFSIYGNEESFSFIEFAHDSFEPEWHKNMSVTEYQNMLTIQKEKL